jgi:hypothetical protein
VLSFGVSGGGRAVNWGEGWSSIDDAGTARNLEAERARELSPTHPRFNVRVTAIGLGTESDDVLFLLLDRSGRLANVHLTWRQGPEPPPWPHTMFYTDEADCSCRNLIEDHEEFGT